jgi:hypothetical protein
VEPTARGETPDPCARTAAELFAILWETLADVIGSAATATLVRRAARRARVDGLSVGRGGLNYVYQLPPDWREREPSVVALRALARELGPILAELTGAVLLRRLGAVRELEACGIRFVRPEENPQ